MPRHRIWNFASTNPLVSGLLVLIIFSVGGTIWASLATWGAHWFWADSGVSYGGVVLCMLSALLAIVILAFLLQRERRAGGRWGGVFNLDRLGLEATDRAALTLLAQFDGVPLKLQAIQKALGLGHLEVKAMLNKLHGLDLAKLMPGDYVELTMYGIECARQNNLLPKPAGLGNHAVRDESPNKDGVSPQNQNQAPTTLNATETAVLQCLGNIWQPGVPVQVQWCALTLGMSAIQVSTAVDGLTSKQLVAMAVPGAVVLTGAGRSLCVERGWHGALEAHRRSDPRAP